MKRLNLFFLYLFCVFADSAQDVKTPNAVQDSIFKQLELFPQEKIHLHTDRTMYVAGEKIWFRAYVVDAFSHRSPTYSQYVYVELINSSDLLIRRVMVGQDENGLFHGNILLAEIPEGDYTLRAYTRYMENRGDGYFFKKHIRVGNLKVRSAAELQISNYEHSLVLKNNIMLSLPEGEQLRNQRSADFEVAFFPEGGNVVDGVINRIAFKALNQQGESEIITGSVVDNDGVPIVADVTTVFAGMGSFAFIPEQKATYYLVCKSSSGLEKRFKLPDAGQTRSLHTLYRDNVHFIQLKTTPGLPERPLFLLVHCKGKVLYFARWNYRDAFISFSDDRLPSGVIQVMLLDEQMHPLSERLIFNKKDDQAKLTFASDKQNYQIREKVTAEICLTDMEGITLGGNVSIAVTDDEAFPALSYAPVSLSILPAVAEQDSRQAESSSELIQKAGKGF